MAPAGCITLSYGLRFETQNAIHDHADWAPRVAIAWGIDGKGKNAAKTVAPRQCRFFYDRFAESSVLNANRMNGLTRSSSSLPPRRILRSISFQSCRP
jgi:hypothetical protein